MEHLLEGEYGEKNPIECIDANDNVSKNSI